MFKNKTVQQCVIILIVSLAGLFAGGCNWFQLPLYAIFGQTHTNVKAEYTALAGKKIAIVIATGPSTNFDYPQARTNITLAIIQTITKHVKNVQFVDRAEIEKFQKENLDWGALSMGNIARRFGAQRVLYLDLYQFTMYEPNSINLLRGNIAAAMSVYEADSANPDRQAYHTNVEIVYPENQPVPLSGPAMKSVQYNAIVLFADQVARKFYDHKIKNK
jgi:hypothetical protein